MEKTGVNKGEETITNTKGSFDVRCAIIREKQKELEKGQRPGDATEVESAGSKRDISKEIEKTMNNLIEVNAQTHNCGFDPETGLAIRIIDGQVVKVNKDMMKIIREERVKTGKPVQQVKGSIKQSKTNNQEDQIIRD